MKKVILIGFILFMFFYFVQPQIFATENNNQPNFPECNSLNGVGDKAHYEDGLHQIFNAGLLQGKDDVYSLENRNFVQCFCDKDRNGIQTNWWRTDTSLLGWKDVNGEQWGLGDYIYLVQNSEYKCSVPDGVTPTPIIDPTPVSTESAKDTPTNSVGSSTEALVCPDGNTINLPANPHVLRSGDRATVNFFLTEGNSANVYWKEVNASDWQHSLSDLKANSDNFVSVEIGKLDPSLGYTFGVQQKKGCGGGQLVTAVVIDGPETQLFQFSYWEWSK